MKLGTRRWLVALVVVGMMATSASIVMAREFPYHHDYRAGIHEIGMYVVVIPGTYGHLWPIRPLIPTEPEGGGGKGVGAASAGLSFGQLEASTPQASVGCSGSAEAAVPEALNRALSGPSKQAGTGDLPLGTFLSGGSDQARVERIDSGLRDLISQLQH